MGVETAVVSANWVSLVSMWEAPTSPPHRDGCSDIEVSEKMDVATGVRSSCGGLWWRGRWCYSRCCVNWLVEGVVPTVSPIKM
jgi:hypothetical protein